MAADVSLRLIGTSDLHANVFPYDYYRDRPDDTVGLARTASLIAKARAEVKNSLLLEATGLPERLLGNRCSRIR